MPVVPVAQNRVGIAEISGAKLRAPDMGGGIGDALAVGAQKIGGALAQFAITQDEIQDHADKLAARNLALSYKGQAEKRAGDFGLEKGANAVNGSMQAQLDINGYREAALTSAANPRQRAYLEPMLAELHPNYTNSVFDHSKREMFTMSNETYAAEAKSFGNDAALNFGDPAKQAAAFEKGDGAIDRLGRLNGWTPEVVADKKLTLRSAAHSQAIDSMMSGADPDVDTALAYFDAHKGEMTAGDQSRIMGDMQKPLQWRQAQDDIAGIVPVSKDGAPAGVLVKKPGTGYSQVAIDVAQEFGLDPVDVAAVMSYETGGTFNPKIMGGKGGQYMGLIQFGPNERRDYGINENSSPEQWSKAVRSFLKDRGFKKGMSTLDLYSTINAGSPGHYNASDSKDPKTGKKNTVTTHHDKIMAEHRGKGERWLKGGGAEWSTETPQEWDKNAAYNAIDARADAGNWTPERRERAKQAMDVKIQRDEQLKAREERTADGQAMEVVFGLGDNFTSMSQIPDDVRKRMSRETVMRFSELADKNLTAKNTIPDNTQDSLYLQRLQREKPEVFASMDLAGFVGKVSTKDLQGLWLKQGEIRGKPQAKDDVRSGISSAITWGQKYQGAKISDADWPAVYDHMDAYLKIRKEKKGLLEQSDYTDAFLSAVKVAPGNSSKNFEAFRDGIDPEWEKRFRENWRGPRQPSKSDIIAGWIKYKGGA